MSDSNTRETEEETTNKVVLETSDCDEIRGEKCFTLDSTKDELTKSESYTVKNLTLLEMDFIFPSIVFPIINQKQISYYFCLIYSGKPYHTTDERTH